MTIKSLKKQLAAAIAMVMVSGVALGSSTYAWFVNNAQVTATNVNVQAATAYSLLISQDNSTWGTTTKLDALTNKLTPVSTVGQINATEKTLSAKTADDPAVGIGDGTTVEVGDLSFVTGTKWENNFMVEYKEVSKDSKTADATLDDTSKYFYSEKVYLKAAQASKLMLDSNGIKIAWTPYGEADVTLYSLTEFTALTAETISDGDTEAAEKKEYNDKLTSAQALLKTLRVGFVITQGTGEDTEYRFYEYQLVKDYIVDANAVNTTTNSTSGAEGLTKAVDITGSVAAITNKAATMDGKTILDYAANGSQSAMVSTADQADKTVLASLDVNEVVTCDIYVWMEGCDYDTVAANIASFSGTGVTGLQFGFCLGE